MPFEVLETEPKELSVPTALIQYMRPMPRGKKDPTKAAKYNRATVRPQLKITLPTTICGTGKAKAHVLLLGTGTDKGKARIKGAPDGNLKAVEPKELAHSFTWNFGFVPKLSDEIADAERVPCRKIGDNEFEIDLPAWWT